MSYGKTHVYGTASCASLRNKASRYYLFKSCVVVLAEVRGGRAQRGQEDDGGRQVQQGAGGGGTRHSRLRWRTERRARIGAGIYESGNGRAREDGVTRVLLSERGPLAWSPDVMWMATHRANWLQDTMKLKMTQQFLCWPKKNCIPWSLINVGLGRQRQKIQVCLDSSPCMNGVKSGGGRMNLADGEELTEREW